MKTTKIPRKNVTTLNNSIPEDYKSVIPHMDPDTPYIARWGHKDGKALDHIYTPAIFLDRFTTAKIDTNLCYRLIACDHDMTSYI